MRTAPRQSICAGRVGNSRRVAGVGGDDAAVLVVSADRAIMDGPEIDLQHVVSDIPSAMRALDIVVAHPGPQDLIELRPVAWLGCCCCLARDWEKTIESAKAWVLIAHIRRMTRFLAGQ